MKYLLLSYRAQAEWDLGREYADTQPWESGYHADVVARRFVEPGELVCAGGLADPSHIQTVDVRGGTPVVIEGPAAEAKEVLATFGLVDVASHDRALEIAAQLSVVLGRIEVRPMDDDADDADA